jgi:hypothetical protein
MTEKDLEVAKKLDARIKELDNEIMALFDAKGKKINPHKPFTIKKSRWSGVEETTITLSGQDITILQTIRVSEKLRLEELLKQM